MIRKNIWINCLIIGISLILTISCERSDYYERISYKYKNKTNHKIYMVVEGKYICDAESDDVIESPAIFNINQMDSLTMVLDGLTNDRPSKKPNRVIWFSSVLGDSVKIIFDSVRYIIFKKDTPGIDQIYYEENYEYKRLGDLEFKFTYTFTEQDYENAMLLE